MRAFRPLMALLLAAGLAGCTSYGSYGYQEGYAYPSYDYGYAYPSYGYYPGYAYGPDVGLGFSYYNYNYNNYGPSYRGGYGYGHQGDWNRGHWNNNGQWNGGSNGQWSGSAPPSQAPMQRPILPPSGYADNGTTRSTHGGAETYHAQRPYPWCPTCRS